jgi:hypothetical protein
MAWYTGWLATTRGSGRLTLVQGLAEHGFDYGLAADVEFFGGGFEFFEKSTLTRWMGFIILPELVKKRETSLPLFARRAMASAEMGFFLERVFFMEGLAVPVIEGESIEV